MYVACVCVLAEHFARSFWVVKTLSLGLSTSLSGYERSIVLSKIYIDTLEGGAI